MPVRETPATGQPGPPAFEFTILEQIAAINRSQAEINAGNLRDHERQRELLDAQRREIDARLAELRQQRQNLDELMTTAGETAKKWAAAQQALAEADIRLAAAAERERNLEQHLSESLEREIFPKCLCAQPFNQWRAEVLAGAGASEGSNANLASLRASLHLLSAAFQSGDPEEICRALSYLGRSLYRQTAPEMIDEIARSLNATANNRYAVRVPHAGEPTEKSWMSFSGIASVSVVHNWAVLGPDRLKRYAAEVG